MVKWLLRVLVVLAVLAIVLVVAVELVLRSGFPKSLVIDNLQKQTGLKFEADSMTVGWAGTSVLRNVRVSVPLADEPDPFAVVPRLDVQHSGLLAIAWFRAVEITSLDLHEPLVRLRRDGQGQWNLLRAIAAIQERQRAKPDRGGFVDQLPSVAIHRATVTVPAPLVGPSRETLRLGPLAFEGHPVEGVVWRFAGEWEDVARVEGSIAPGPSWRHEARVVVADLAPVLSSLVPPSDVDIAAYEPMRGAIEWKGQLLQEGGAGGTLRVAGIRAGPVEAHGTVRFEAAPGGVGGPMVLSIEPERLSVLVEDFLEGQPVTLVGGRVELRGGLERIDLMALQVESAGHLAELRGEFRGAEREGRLTADWRGHVDTPTVDHRGQASFDFDLSGVGGPVAHVQIDSTGQSPWGRWEALTETNLTADNGFNQVTAHVTAPTLVWTQAPEATADEAPTPASAEVAPARVIDLSGLAFEVQSAGENVSLTSVQIPGAAKSRVDGRVHTVRGDWLVSARLEDWRIPASGLEPMRVTVDARGRGQRVDRADGLIEAPELRIALHGDHLPDREAPLRVRVEADGSLSWPSEQAESAPVERTLSGAPVHGLDPEAPGEDPPVAPEDTGSSGTARFVADASGSAWPFALELDGLLTLADLSLAGKPVAEEIAIPWRAWFRDNEGAMDTAPFELLGGEWRLTSTYSPDLTDALVVSLDGRDVPLQRLADLAGLPLDQEGALTTAINVALPDLDPDLLRVDGDWSVGPVGTGDFVRLERGQGRFTTSREGLLRLEDLRLELQDGVITGTADFNLRERDRLVLDLQSRDWPLEFKGETETAMRIDGGARVSVDVSELTADGQGRFIADLTVNGIEMGSAEVDAGVEGRVVSVRRLDAQVCGGQVDGEARIDLDDWTRSLLQLKLSDLDLARMAACWELTTDQLEGLVSGTVSIQPATADEHPRALEPVVVDVDLNIESGRFRELEFADVAMLGFAGPERFVLNAATFNLAGGVAEVWGRLTAHSGSPFVHFSFNASSIELNQVVQAAVPGYEPVLGKVGGRGAIGGYVFHPHRGFGEMRFQLSESDLGRVPIFAGLYNVLNLQFGEQQPTGRGEATVRLEGDALRIDRMTYYNRGVDAVASLTVENVWALGASPVRGVAAGSLRPFGELDIPVIADLDDIIEALQADVATVRIEGTLSDIQVNPVPFSDVGGSIGRLLRGSTAN